MPAPTASQIEPLAQAAFAGAGLRGEAIQGLQKALARTTASALSTFLNQAMILPGIPASAPPPSGSGSTTGPGRLTPPPAGGPTAGQLRSVAETELRAEGIRGEQAGALAAAIAESLAQAISMFTANVQVAPGVAISGFTTTAPGRLV